MGWKMRDASSEARSEASSRSLAEGVRAIRVRAQGKGVGGGEGEGEGEGEG